MNRNGNGQRFHGAQGKAGPSYHQPCQPFYDYSHNRISHQPHHFPIHEDHALISTLYKIFIAFMSTLCLIGLTTTLLILYVSVRPFSIPTYRRLAANLGAAAWIDAMALLLPNMRLYLTGDSDVPSPVGASVLVCNHSMDGDWWALLMLCRCVGLRGSVKAFLQRENNSTTEPNGKGNGINGGVSGNGSPSSGNSSIVMSTSAPALAGANVVGNGGVTTNPTLIRNHSMGPLFQNHVSGNNGNTSTSTNSTSAFNRNTEFTQRGKHMSLAQHFLHNLLEFPLLSAENNKNYIQDRDELFTLLRSFAEGGAPAPVHLLLFPEGWSLEGDDRQSMLAKSVEFAKREGRPLLKHLLLPRTTGFYASLDSLRESSPVVYDVTIAYQGYDGKKPFSFDVTWPIIKRLVSGQIPSEIHIHIRRYSSMEVLADARWLDKQWAEKDRLLTHFARHQQFPVGNRGFIKHRVFDTRSHSVENSVSALLRLGMIPFAIPIILLLAIPLLWVVLWCLLAHRAFILLFPDGFASLLGDEYHDHSGPHESKSETGSVGGTDSAVTPFFPATPFASPNIWSGNGDSQPGR